MRIKTGLFVGLCFLMLAGLPACIGGNDEQDLIISKDAQIVTFSLSHDSISALANAKFTIDQAGSLVYNHDSLPYLTNLTKYPRVKVTYTTGSGISNLVIFKEGTVEDSIGVASGDSIDIFKVKKFRIYAPDGTETTKGTGKIYTLSVNVHQIDPDSVQYLRIGSLSFLANGENKIFRIDDTYYMFIYENISSSDTIMNLYVSVDMENWKLAPAQGISKTDDIFKNLQASESGFYSAAGGELYTAWKDEARGISDWQKITTEYPVTAVLGYLAPTLYGGKILNEGGLALVVEKGGANIFAFTKDLLEFNYGDVVPENFPLSEFSVLHNQSVSLNKITLVGSTVWGTENGLYWANLSNDTRGNLPSITGGTAFLYNNEIWFFGGKTGENYNRKVYYSIDGGMVWKTKETKAQVPADFHLRESVSIITDKEGAYFYIVGGENQTDIWKGVLNSQLFEH